MLSDQASETWKALPWKKFEKHVFRIQKRIFRASQRGNRRAVQKLQKLLMKSEAARMLAVRRVTQDNQGKKTAGVDGVKSVPPKHRFPMVKRLHPAYWKRSKTLPVRRVWIPKPGKDEQRPLGIPTMSNRAHQCLVKLALEPEWEACFEPNSYGFRPGRSCHDAIGAIFNAIRLKPKFVYDADVKGCFDNIDHTALLEKLQTFPAIRQAIKGWLKAGIMEGQDFTPTETGVPQGGVISPLLMNVALHGLEQTISKIYQKKSEKPLLIRYADDFVLFHTDVGVLQQAATEIVVWLAQVGLHMNPKKTRITHTLTPYEGRVGLDFLGFEVRQYPVGKTHTGKNTNGKSLGFKTIIKPSKETTQRHMRELKNRIKKKRAGSQPELLKELNPVVRGWANYYKTVVASYAFSKCDHLLHYQLRRWAQFKHPQKSAHWRKQKYWRTEEGRAWVFATPEGAKLRTHSMTPIQRHAKVRGDASPYDGNLLYWSQRLKAHPLLYGTLAALLHKQQGKCKWCGLYFKDGDIIEIDHTTPKSQGGGEELGNKSALHRHCHDERHAKLNEFDEQLMKLKESKKQEVAGIIHK